MTNPITAAEPCPVADAQVRPAFTFSARSRDGADFHDGAVIRVFPPHRSEGYSPAHVAEMIHLALDAAREQRWGARLVVLPAGVGVLDPIVLPTEDWTDLGRLAVRDAISRWGTACGTGLPGNHPPVVLGLDGTVVFAESGPWTQAVQAAVVVDGHVVTHVTHKTKARDSDEAAALDIAWDDDADRPEPDALVRHHPIVDILGERTLLLVCHDAAAFSARSRAASSPDGVAAAIHAQYERLLRAPDAPRTAVNLVHQLPRHATARLVTSPVFQNAHRVLHDEHGLRVVAVTGLHPDDRLRAFERVHTHLRCDFRHVDVFVDLLDP